MNDPAQSAEQSLNLSPPVFADNEIQFSAFALGWGFCSYALPFRLVVAQLGASNSSEQQLNLAFQLNRHRILAAVAEGGMQDPGRRVVLLKI
ncbi:hypothetical protein NOV72_04905 [Caballeronia novacaledonica]|uniref:Uncharacterized protein n=1 Tax=Caballeronia novacaledonica TaxID=1544861 RepID=A0A2U3IBX2_9BURK|nr:hypothetical protein [Caballeronia novacaledonica]SPB17700.1 hypothetical protein NOV72_04905 [Caballeronia novacaledonica]